MCRGILVCNDEKYEVMTNGQSWDSMFGRIDSKASVVCFIAIYKK